MKWKRFLWLILPVIVYAGLIFYMSSMPSIKQPQQYIGIKEVVSDKFLHTIEFFILGLLLLRWFYNTKYRGYAFYLAILITVVYAFFDEFHQFFVPNRAMDLLDFLFDCFGALLIVVFRIKILRRLLTLGTSSSS